MLSNQALFYTPIIYLGLWYSAVIDRLSIECPMDFRTFLRIVLDFTASIGNKWSRSMWNISPCILLYTVSINSFSYSKQAIFNHSQAMTQDLTLLSPPSQKLILNSSWGPNFLTNSNLGGWLLPVDLHRNTCGCTHSLRLFSRNVRNAAETQTLAKG